MLCEPNNAEWSRCKRQKQAACTPGFRLPVWPVELCLVGSAARLQHLPRQEGSSCPQTRSKKAQEFLACPGQSWPHEGYHDMPAARPCQVLLVYGLPMQHRLRCAGVQASSVSVDAMDGGRVRNGSFHQI